jgi:hypothetical protein
MRNIILVIKHEIIITLQKRSFWVTAFLFPLVIVGINLGTQMLINRPEGSSLELTPTAENADRTMVIGYVDQASLIKEIPADVPQGLLQGFPNEEAAQAAVKGGQIDEYAIIARDYLQTGNLVVVQRNFQPLGSTPGSVQVRNRRQPDRRCKPGSRAQPAGAASGRARAGSEKRRQGQQSAHNPGAHGSPVHFLLPAGHEQRLHAAERLT